MSADDEAPVVDWVREQFGHVEVGPRTVQEMALYGSFVGLGVVFGALLTVGVVLGAGEEANPFAAMGEPTVYELTAADAYGAAQWVAVGGAAVFLACHALALAVEFRQRGGGE